MLSFKDEYCINISEYKTHKKLKKYLENYKKYSTTIDQRININFFTYDISYIIINHGNDIVFEIKENTFVLKKNESTILFSSMHEIRMNLSAETNFSVLEFKAAKLAYFFPFYIHEDNIGFSKITSGIFNEIEINTDTFSKKIDEILLHSFGVIKTPFSILNLIDYLEENNGVYDIESVLLLVNVPRRVLDKAFRLYIGMSVKTYASIIKLKCNK